MLAIRKSRRSLLLLLGIAVFISVAMLTPAGAQTRTIDSWLEFRFASDAPMGDSRNPAVILPSALANIVGNVPGAKRSGDVVFIPAIEFQKIANQPLASLAL